MKNTLERLQDTLQLKQRLSSEELNAFLNTWQPYSVKRKEIITRTGDSEKYLYFVIEGVQRVYHYSTDDKETTLIFTYPYSFGGVVDSFLLQEASKYSYESLTPSVFLRMHHQSFRKTIAAYPNIDHLMRQYTHRAFAGLLERMVELQSFSSEKKFKTLLKRSPHILQLVPHKYIANYLGIDPTNFSKLINKVKI